MIIVIENTNIEDIPNALIFRATCYDDEGIKYLIFDCLLSASALYTALLKSSSGKSCYHFS